MANRRAYFKPLKELTPEEMRILFRGEITIPEWFLEKYGEYSVKTFPEAPPQSVTNPIEAYYFGCITGLKMQIPENKLVAIFGAPGCGKSYLIRLVASLKGKSVEEIKTLLSDEPINDEEAFKIKEVADSFLVVPKKTTRPARDKEKGKHPEILEGIAREEVEACDFKYEYAGNLYGFSKKDIDEALLDGNVIMIVNDLETISKLNEAYSHQFKPTFICRAKSLEEWEKSMSEAGRNSGEIRNRAQKYWESENLYHDKIVDITFPEAILNKPDLDGFSAKTLLLQLKRIVNPQRAWEDRTTSIREE